MKQPKLNNLKIDQNGTKVIRTKMTKSKKIKITINIDEDLLYSLRNDAEKAGIPYQSFINRLLRTSFNQSKINESRLDKLEREIKKINKKLSA